MGRAERRRIARQNQKEIARIDRMSQDQKTIELYRNGITEADLMDAYKRGYREAQEKLNSKTQELVFAGICMALNQNFGFGRKRCLRVIDSAYTHVLTTIDTNEKIQEVWDTMGLMLQLDDPLEPILLLEPKRRRRKCPTSLKNSDAG